MCGTCSAHCGLSADDFYHEWNFCRMDISGKAYDFGKSIEYILDCPLSTAVLV